MLTKVESAPEFVLPQGPFTTIVCDPPWRFLSRRGRGSPEDLHCWRYATLSYEQLRSLPIPQMVAERAHLYLWVPTALTVEGWQLAAHWGFQPRQELIWVKLNRRGDSLRMGLGRHYRNVHEKCLFAVRGKLPLRQHNLVTVLLATNEGHSRKPKEFYNLVERASPGPYVDLFARRTRPGWVCWGDEVGK